MSQITPRLKSPRVTVQFLTHQQELKVYQRWIVILQEWGSLTISESSSQVLELSDPVQAQVPTLILPLQQYYYFCKLFIILIILNVVERHFAKLFLGGHMCSVVRSIVTKVKETSRDYLQWIGWGDSGLRTGDVHGARKDEGVLK